MAHQSPFSDLIPELFPIITAHLPLHLTPSTLLSLAVTNHRISKIVLPLLYQRLILKDIYVPKVMPRLLDEPELGKSIRELHILADQAAIRGGFFHILNKAITKGSLPYIHTLSLFCLQDWFEHGDFESLPAHFWIDLKINCPRLRGLILRGIRVDQNEPFIDNSGVLEVQDVTILTLNFRNYCGFRAGATETFFNSLSANLHTLDLCGLLKEESPGISRRLVSRSPLLKLTLPKLVSLRLADFTLGMPTESMAFFKRHPSLTYLDIVNDGWFSRGSVSAGLLPKLSHLKSHINNLLSLAPILHRLKSLTVYGSVNAQVPYLLRSVLPHGLPNLKSLSISQRSMKFRKEGTILEGGLWYETKSGEFFEAEHSKAERYIWSGYIHSIVRGAPNVEEIAFNAGVRISYLPLLASDLSHLPNLRRLYYQGSFRWFTDIDIERLTLNSRYLAKVCKSLEMVVDMRNCCLPYVAAKISRNEFGLVSRVVLGNGYGMQICNEDEAFPT